MPLGLPNRLSPKQHRFVLEYARDWNATAAAIRAGYKPRAAAQQGARLLRNVKVAGALQAYTSALAAESHVTLKRLVEHYARIAFSRVCPVDYYYTDARGRVRLRPAHEWTDEMRLMQGRMVETHTGVRIRLQSRLEALKMLTRYTGGFDK